MRRFSWVTEHRRRGQLKVVLYTARFRSQLLRSHHGPVGQALHLVLEELGSNLSSAAYQPQASVRPEEPLNLSEFLRALTAV